MPQLDSVKVKIGVDALDQSNRGALGSRGSINIEILDSLNFEVQSSKFKVQSSIGIWLYCQPRGHCFSLLAAAIPMG